LANNPEGPPHQNLVGGYGAEELLAKAKQKVEELIEK